MKYYLHDTNARNDEKVTMLFIEYGYEGVGLFYAILEVLASQEKPVSEMVLKSQLKIKKKLEKQLCFMYKIEILSLKNGDVFNENLLNFSEKYQIKKEKTRKKVSEWREKQADKKVVTDYVPISNHRKVNKSKVKESKELPQEENPDTMFISYKNSFIEKYNILSGSEYYFTAQDGVKINSLIKKITHAYQSAGVEIPTDAQLVNGFKHILERALNDKWLKDNFSLSNIDSQFNKLKLKNNGTPAEKANDLYTELVNNLHRKED